LISLAAVTLRGTPATELIEAAAAARFDAVGVRLSSWDPASRERPTAQLLRNIAELSSALGVSVHDVEQIRLLPDTSPRDYEYLFEAAATLGASFALIFADDPDEGRFIDRLNQLDQIARPYRVHPVLELMPFTAVKTLTQILEILGRAELERPALLIDTLHLARSGAQPGDLDAIDPELLPFVHLADGPIPGPDTPQGLREEATFSRLLPGRGDLPLKAYLDRLPSSIPLALEVPGASEGTTFERAAAAAAATRDLLTAMGEMT
jgi:sugar phosphate isomerase/epimerase